MRNSNLTPHPTPCQGPYNPSPYPYTIGTTWPEYFRSAFPAMSEHPRLNLQTVSSDKTNRMP